jgi:ABC-type sugar transport system ATPase subunit
MIEIRDLTFTYPAQPAPLFDAFAWHVARGEFWAVIGTSGCGKSTLLHLIIGLRAPSAGTIVVNGERVPRKQQRGKTGLVLQDYGLLPWATVRENVELGLRIREFYGQDDRRPTTDDRRVFSGQRSTVGGRILVGTSRHRASARQVPRATFRRAAAARRDCAYARDGARCAVAG